jgi:hypothetical protein
MEFFNYLSRDFVKTTITAMYHGRWFAYWSYLVQNERRERNTCSFRSLWVTLPLNLFFHSWKITRSFPRTYVRTYYSAGQTVPSTAQIRAEGNNTKCVEKKRFNGSVTHRLRKEHVLRVYTPVQHNFHIDPIISPCQFIFQPFVTWLRENYDYRSVSWEMICVLVNMVHFGVRTTIISFPVDPEWNK